jgi:hypothetical protein
MNKKEAIQEIKEIQNGSGINRSFYPNVWKGDMAKDLWDEVDFAYGMEYGYILGLLNAFELSSEEIDNYEKEN